MVLLDDILWKCNTVMARCVVDKANMLANIESQNGLVMAEKVMLALVDEGMHRDEAHEALRTASMTSLEKGVNLLETCRADPSITDLIDGVTSRPSLTRIATWGSAESSWMPLSKGQGPSSSQQV